jgi:hypothetical protein
MLDTISDLLRFVTPLRIIKRLDSLVIQDYRPTWAMFLGLIGSLVFAAAFISFLLSVDIGVDSFGMWSTGLMTLGCLVYALRGTLREVYYFDKTSGAYAFVRQFLYKKEVIEGGLSQFRAVRVHMEIRLDGDGHTSPRYIISLLQDGMLLGGAHEQPLREQTPILNSHANAVRIASAIASFLDVELHDTCD